jgi:hypothetical protein
MKTFYAYIHAKPDGTPFYVGKGWGRRANDFLLRNPYHKNTTAKYGVDNILVGTIDCSSEKIAFELECGLIKCLKRMNISLTNLTDGGEGRSGSVASEATKAKMSAARLGKKIPFRSLAYRAKQSASKKGKPGHLHSPESLKKLIDNHVGMTGKKHTPEALAKIRAAGMGRVHTPEAIQKMRDAQKGRVYPKLSDETKEKMRESATGKQKSESHRANISAALKGKAKSAEHRANLSAARKRHCENIKLIGVSHVFTPT